MIKRRKDSKRMRAIKNRTGAVALVLLGLLLMARSELRACTTIIVGKKATVDGSVIVAHSDDDVADERVIYVPAADHPKGAKRPVYYDDASLGHKGEYNSTALRRYIGNDRGPGYDTKDYPPSKPLGYIPQVTHTYAYFDSNYGMMNEHQLMIGECTCGAKVHPQPKPGKRIFYSSELSRVALERCKSARDAIKLIGQLIKKYGYYGTGETLLIGDPEEAWVMEMCGYKEKGGDGIWVAQRVPDDGFFVAANEFRIREVKKNSPDMMYSENLFKVCKKKGWWKPSDGPLDWLKAVSWGEYSHPYYSLRRVWRAPLLGSKRCFSTSTSVADPKARITSSENSTFNRDFSPVVSLSPSKTSIPTRAGFAFTWASPREAATNPTGPAKAGAASKNASRIGRMTLMAL